MSSTTRNSALCPNCRKLISLDEPVCPYCGMSKPGSPIRKFLFTSGSNIDAVRLILFTNIVFYIASLLVDPSGMGALLSPSETGLFLLGATGTIPIGHYGHWWTLLTASFLHGGLLHIFFNMMALFQLGPFIISEFGMNRFLIIYILTGIGGFFVSLIAGVSFTIGASASVCGLIGAILYYGKRRGGTFGDMIYRQAMGWIVGMVVFGLFFPGINNWAHGGGIFTGVVIARILGYQDDRQETSVDRFLALFCVAITLCALAWGIMGTLFAMFMR